MYCPTNFGGVPRKERETADSKKLFDENYKRIFGDEKKENKKQKKRVEADEQVCQS